MDPEGLDVELGFASGMGNHNRAHDLTPLRVGDADDRDLHDRGVIA